MIWYITLKDIKSFYQSGKSVFIWLIICMICGAFVLNYSYSFARYRGEIYEYNSGASIARYQINGTTSVKVFYNIIEEIASNDFPEISDYQLFNTTSEGYVVVGSSFISEESAAFTGLWKEGYATKINNTEVNACAVSDRLLEYDNRLKMVGENFRFDNEDFIIRGVFEMSTNADVVIFADRFLKKYDDFKTLWITFDQKLSEEQELDFKRIIKERIPNSNITFPPAKGEVGSDIVKSNELQYTAIIMMLIICLVSVIKYWQETNISTYTIYWINGATRSTIMLLALCESFVLCFSTYIVGLGLNTLSRFFLSRNAPLKLFDIVLGFGVFFGVFAIFTLINTSRICKTFSVTKVRRD
ncbi:MAG: hypothetical protein IJ366_07880 [Clostridia bacterium]|nr:hypothetical protein [Clostridia bacterium]